MVQRGTVFLMILGGALALQGCSSVSALNPFSRSTAALPYASSLSADRATGELRVSVRAGGAGLDAVRESARQPVTEYCLRQRGSSDADWVTDPATRDWAAQRDERGNLLLRARCRA